jgi:hypothetical protein
LLYKPPKFIISRFLFRYYKTPQDTNCQGSLNVLEYYPAFLMLIRGLLQSNKMTLSSSRYKVSDGAAWYMKNASKRIRHPLIIMLTPSNHSVSMRDYLFELKTQSELESWTKALEEVHNQGDFIVLCLPLNRVFRNYN